MQYLNRKGDMEETAKIPSIPIINNWKMKVPKFCFIIPTYKRADLLLFAINSILEQKDAPEFEILVVDDCPDRNDETEKLMSAKYDQPGIAYFKNSCNLRQEGNWNKLFSLARTEWMIMLHDDDMLYPDYFRYMQKCMELYPNGIGGFFPSFIGHEFMNDVLPVRKNQNIRALLIKEIDFLRGCILGAPVGMCIKRSIVHQIGGVNNNSGVAVDYDFYNRLVKHTEVVKMYGYPTGVWRILANVSQHKRTVLACVEYGDVLKYETLKDCRLGWLKPLYASYVKAFDNQHIRSWYKSMNKSIPADEKLPPVNTMDRIIYLIVKTLLVLQKRMRLGQKNIKVQHTEK